MGVEVTDRIEKEIVISAPRSRVWRAIADPQEFGSWFKVDMTGVEFKPGQPVEGKMTYPGYEGAPFEMVVDQMQAEQLFSFRWHPYSPDPNLDITSEPMTLVEFRLQDVQGGTRVRITESGFDAIPLSRRAEAFRMNEGGWEEQIHNLEAYARQGS